MVGRSARRHSVAARRLLAPASVLAAALVLTVFAVAALGSGSTTETAYAAKPPTKTPTPAAATPTPGPAATATATAAAPAGCTVGVSTAAGLATALQNAQPGHVICLASGTYAGRFVATASGTSSNRIVLSGPAAAVLDGGSTATGYGLHLNGASNWDLRGFTVRNSKKGIMLDAAGNNLIDGVTIRDVGEEGIHFRTHSSNNTLQNATIANTGLYTPGFGEGVYIGSANSNWKTYTNGQPDRSDNNRIVNNHLGPDIRAETIDVKEGTTGGTISGNYLDATGITGANYADSWIDVKGNNYTISGNTGRNPSSDNNFLDGFQIHVPLSGWGSNNTFASNDLDVRAAGYGFSVQSTATGNRICTNNTVTNAAAGFANVTPVTC